MTNLGVEPDPTRTVGEQLYEALAGYGPMGLLINETMLKAQPVSELGRKLFTGVAQETADRAASGH